MQSLKYAEDLLVIFGRDSNAVIRHAKQPQAIFSFGRHMNAWRPVAPVLEGIGNQVLEELNEMVLVPWNAGQFIARYNRARLLDSGLAVFDCLRKNLIEIDRRKRFRFLTSANQLSIGEKVRQ